MNALYRISVVIMAVFIMGSAWAGNVTIPNTFSSGTPAVAAEVNDNFNAVKTEVDDNAADILVNAGDIITNTTAIADKVDEAGGTMTGDLIVNARVGVGASIQGGELFVKGTEGRTYGNFTNAVIYSSRVYNDNSGGSIGFGGTFNSIGGTTLFAGVYGRKENLIDGDGDGYLAFTTRNTINTEKVRITSSGNVGIGTTNPTYPLEMSSGAHVTVGGVWTNASSLEYKKDVDSLSLEQALDTLTKLSPVTFRYKTAPEEKHVGFIAEKVPDLVATLDRKGVSPMDIVAVLTRVVQYQQKEIEGLKARLDAEEK